MPALFLFLWVCGSLEANAGAHIPASVLPQNLSLSESSRGRLAPLERRISQTLSGRTLLAMAHDIPRREIRGVGLAFGYRHGAPGILAVDPIRLGHLSDAEAELAWVGALARAAAGLPFPMAEEGLLSIRKEMAYALEKSRLDPKFNRWLRRLVEMAQTRRRSFALLDPSGAVPPPAPRNEEERLAYALSLFAESPDECAWALEWGSPSGPEEVSFWALEDFMDRYADDLGSLVVAGSARAVRFNGRRYPASLPRAAQSLLVTGGIERVRRSLADLEEAPTKAFHREVAGWLNPVVSR